jgi:hypothetical protein
MSSGEVISEVKVIRSVDPDSHTGAVNGAEFDTAGWNEAIVIFSAGTVAATGTLNCKVQETATSGSGYADISGAAFAQVTDANDNAIYIARLKLGAVKGRLRYMRAVMTQATAAARGACVIVLCGPLEASLATNEGGYQDIAFDKQ